MTQSRGDRQHVRKKSWNESFLPEVKSVLLQRKVSERDKQNYSKKTVAKTFKTVQTLTLQKDNLWNCKMKIKVHKLQIHSFDNENWRIYALHFSLKNAVRELTFRRHVTNRQTSRTVNMSPAAIPVTITTMELGEDASDQSNTDLLPFTALESVTPRKWKKQKNNFSFFPTCHFQVTMTAVAIGFRSSSSWALEKGSEENAALYTKTIFSTLHYAPPPYHVLVVIVSNFFATASHNLSFL